VLLSYVQAKFSKRFANFHQSEPVSSPIFSTIAFENLGFLDFKRRLDHNTDFIVSNLSVLPIKKLLRELIVQCKVQCNKAELKQFTKELKLMFDPSFRLLLSDFRALAFSWYQACHSTQDLRAKLMQTIGEFEEVKAGKIAENEKSALEDLLANLRAKLAEMPKYFIREDNFDDKCVAGLHQIFQFYSKQQFLLGKAPTFDVIKSNKEVLTIGKFIRFCKDFRLVNEKDKKSLSKMGKICQNAFVQTAEFGKNMHEHHFIAALDIIAADFFDTVYDKTHNTSWQEMPLMEKRRKLYEVLECHEPKLYNAKLKGLIPHFGVDPPSRLPDYDLSKKYIFKPNRLKETKEKVEMWKKKKNDELNAKTPRVEVESVLKKPQINSYAKSHRAMNKINKISWKGLNDMKPQQFKDSSQELDIDELVIESSEEEGDFDRTPAAAMFKSVSAQNINKKDNARALASMKKPGK
jgi:hypothetical protein